MMQHIHLMMCIIQSKREEEEEKNIKRWKVFVLVLIEQKTPTLNAFHFKNS